MKLIQVVFKHFRFVYKLEQSPSRNSSQSTAYVMIKSNSRHISPYYIDEAENIYTSADIYEFCAYCEQCISECCCDEATKIESDGTSLRKYLVQTDRALLCESDVSCLVLYCILTVT